MRNLALLYCGPSLTWTIVLGVAPFETTISTANVFAVAAAAASTVAIAVSAALRHYFVPKNSKGRWHHFARVVLMAGLAIFGTFPTVSSLLAAAWVVEYQPISYLNPLLIICLCGAVSVLGMMPGLVYIDSKTSGLTRGKSFLNVIYASVFVGYALTSATLLWAPVSKAIFGAVGIYEFKPKIYQILKPELAFAMRAAHLHVVPARDNAATQTYFVGGYLHYNFGGIKLLCAYKPMSAADEGRAALWAEYEKPLLKDRQKRGGSSVDEYALKRAAESRRGLSEGDWCVPVNSDEVRPIHRDASNL